MNRRKVIVIGAGAGGMSAAARLAAAGQSVTVLEAGSTYGGKIGVLKQDGFQWDTGPSLFTQPYLLESLARDCGLRPEEYIRYIKVPEGTRYSWRDGTVLSTPAAKPALAAQVADNLEISPRKLLRYLERAAALYNSTAPIFLDGRPDRLATWLSRRVPRALAHIRPAYLLRTLHQYNAAALGHRKLVQVFDRMATYNGSDPYRCPAMLSAIAHLEFNEGTYYPEGGMRSVADALYRICIDLGVEFEFHTPADRLVREGNKITGVEAKGALFKAESFVCNTDVHQVYSQLLGDKNRAEQTAAPERSTSGMVFYWGVKRGAFIPELHNIFFSDDYRKEFAALRKGALPDDPTIYLNNPSRYESIFAPEGCESWFILVNVPPLPVGYVGDYASETAILRQRVIQRLSSEMGYDVGAMIRSEAVLTPPGIAAATGSYRGALYGTASNVASSAFRRHPVESGQYANLYFCGGTVHPGGGIPLCLRSGKLAAEALLQATA